MAVVKVKNKLNHKLMLEGKILDPGEVVELEENDKVKYAIEHGYVEVVQESPAKEEPVSEQPTQEEQPVEEVVSEASVQVEEQPTKKSRGGRKKK